ncbi:MAG: hypothetical protein Q8O24_08790 [Gallionellaceae bacterium]|nr:hypothetical protein [Gallionellaceae bacterium]
MAEIKQLPNTGFAPSNASIAKHLREQADWIEEDEDAVRNVFIVIEHADGTLRRQTMGMQCDLARAIGVLTVACIRGAMSDDAEE